jgi:cysteine synthase A
MPDSMSVERRQLLSAFGAKIELTPASEGMKGSIDKALEIQKTIENSIILGQFENESNPMAHKETTALEILEDIGERIDFFVSTVGTGGTITGVGEVLKMKYQI